MPREQLDLTRWRPQEGRPAEKQLHGTACVSSTPLGIERLKKASFLLPRPDPLSFLVFFRSGVLKLLFFPAELNLYYKTWKPGSGGARL